MQHAIYNYLIKEDSRTSKYDESEFSDIFEAYYKKIYNYICYRVNCHYTAEDLTSQVFENIMVKLNTYSESKGSFDVWVFAIAKNVINDYFRTKNKHTIISIESIGELFSNRRNPENIMLSSENNKTFLEVLNILTDKEKNIIALKFGADIKNIEIAKVLNISESNVGVILYRTMKKLKNKFEEVDYLEKEKYRK